MSELQGDDANFSPELRSQLLNRVLQVAKRAWTVRFQGAALSVFLVGAFGMLPVHAAQDEGAAKYQQAPLRKDVQAKVFTAADLAEFDHFYSVYSGLLLAELNGNDPYPWQFWVVLAQNPRHDGKLQVLVRARMPRIQVTLARMPLMRSIRRARDAARKSGALSRDPFFAGLAKADDSILELLQPGRQGK